MIIDVVDLLLYIVTPLSRIYLSARLIVVVVELRLKVVSAKGIVVLKNRIEEAI